MTKMEKLARAVDLLHEADSLVQEALEATNACYDLHTRLTDLADDIEDIRL